MQQIRKKREVETEKDLMRKLLVLEHCDAENSLLEIEKLRIELEHLVISCLFTSYTQLVEGFRSLKNFN